MSSLLDRGYRLIYAISEIKWILVGHHVSIVPKIALKLILNNIVLNNNIVVVGKWTRLFY